jgi:hypothetical protein
VQYYAKTLCWRFSRSSKNAPNGFSEVPHHELRTLSEMIRGRASGYFSLAPSSMISIRLWHHRLAQILSRFAVQSPIGDLIDLFTRLAVLPGVTLPRSKSQAESSPPKLNSQLE